MAGYASDRKQGAPAQYFDIYGCAMFAYAGLVMADFQGKRVAAIKDGVFAKTQGRMGDMGSCIGEAYATELDLERPARFIRRGKLLGAAAVAVGFVPTAYSYISWHKPLTTSGTYLSMISMPITWNYLPRTTSNQDEA